MAMIEEFFQNVGALDAISTTLILAFSSTSIATVLGVTFGMLLEKYHFPFKNLVVRINRTLMGVPPVVMGLIVYLLLMRRGPLGKFSLLFTIRGMVIAQVMIITPIISGTVYAYAAKLAPQVRNFAKTVGANSRQTDILVLKEMRSEIYFAIVSGFGRSISEVGAVMLVGGNIKGRTRTMTTAISLLKSQGIYSEGIMLGCILLIIAFAVQTLAEHFKKEDIYNENF